MILEEILNRRLGITAATQAAMELAERIDWRALANVPKVLCNDSAKLYFESEARPDNEWSYTDGKSYGPIRLPFPMMWFEWEAPAQSWFADGHDGPGWYNTPDIARYGFALARSHPQDDGTEVQEWVYGLKSPRETYARLLPVAGMFQVDPDGAWVRNQVVPLMTPAEMRAFGLSSSAELVHAADAWQRITHYAIGLMNCRNVKVEERQPGPTSKRSKRASGKRFSYHVIVLPGSKPGSHQEGRAKAGAPVAAHIARGHFKTYTEDAPLFGSRIGTYWWGAQVRGSKASGRSDHDYEVRSA